MRTDIMGGTSRRQRILSAISDEVGRQAVDKVKQLDIEAIAAAVEKSLVTHKNDVDALSREPDHLNASNDI